MRQPEAHERRKTVGVDKKQIEKGRAEVGDRQGGAEEKEGNDRRLTAKTGHLQALARRIGFERLAQVELLDDPLHEALRLFPQSALALLLGQARDPLGAQALALARHVFHPRAEPVAGQQRQARRR